MITDLSYIREVRTTLPRRIVDGDTWWSYVDLGFRQLGYFEFRLDGWDTPEKHGANIAAFERVEAEEATVAARDWWAEHIKAGGRRILVRTNPDPEKYGRWLAVLWAESSTGVQYPLGEYLAQLGLAVISDGTRGTRWRDTYLPTKRSR